MDGIASRCGEGPLDPARQEALREALGASGLFERIVASFRADTPGALVALRSALAARDARRLSSEAHRLRGACLTLGVPVMAELCGSLEGLPVPDGAQRLIADLESEFERVDAALAAGTGSATLPVHS